MGLPVAQTAESLSGRVSNWSSWLRKGSLALLDQGLISGSNFLVSLLLARWLIPEQYGAYALAFECLLGLSVLYACLVLEPMGVFGPSLYRDRLREYLGVLLRIHLAVALTIVLALGGSVWVAHELARSGSLAGALAGVTLAGPCVLLFWLARRAFYVKLMPRGAVLGGFLYCAVVLGGLLIIYRWRLLSPFAAFLLMAVAGLATAPLLLVRLKPSLTLKHSNPSVTEVTRRHWDYGRWALASSVAMWSAGALYYPLLSSFRGLAQTGELKALMNLSSPVGQAFVAFSLLSLPYASRTYHQGGRAGVERVAWRLTLLYAGGTTAYWALIILLKGPLLRFLYAGKYSQVAGLVPWVALGSVLRIAATSQAIALKAIRLPSLVFVAYGASGAVAALAGIPATWAFGLRGAVLTPILSNATALVLAFILLRRSLGCPAGKSAMLSRIELPSTAHIPNGSSENTRIAFATPSRARGWRSQPVLKEFSRLFPRTVVFTGIWPGFVRGCEGRFEVRQVHVRFFALGRTETGSARGFTWVSPHALWDLLRFRPDVIFTNGFHVYALYAMIVKALRGSRLILLWQGVSPETGGGRGSARLSVRRAMARFFDLTICNTEAGVAYLQNLVGVPAFKIWHRTCEVADPGALSSRGGSKNLLGALDRPVFLFAGRIIRGKGVPKLLTACSLLVEQGLNGFSVVLVGDGIHRKEMEQLARQLGIERQVRWEGFVPFENMGAYYQACDVFILPSVEDTWGVVVPEAMAFGKPILCSRYAGSKEMVRHGVNGFIFDPYSPEQLADYMARFIRESDLIRRFGEASKEVIRPYTPERTARILASAVAVVMASQSSILTNEYQR